MFIHFDADRASDSPFVERVWSCHSEHEGVFQSVASPLSEIVFTRLHGRVMVTLRGPKQVVDLKVQDPEQFKLIKVGDQIQAVYTEAVALVVEPAKK